MGPVEGNMDMLSRAVLNEARTEADQILSEARAKADAIRQRAQEQAAAERKQILARAAEEADRIRRQAGATAQIQARTLQLEQREKLLNDVFEAAQRLLGSVTRWSDYDDIACRLFREALARLEPGSAIVRADAATLRALAGPVLDEISKEMGIKLRTGDQLEQGTGVIVETEDGRRRYDNTLETRLSRMRDTLRSPVYHLLVGESA